MLSERSAVGGILFMLVTNCGFAQTPIECKGARTSPNAYLWPTFYIAKGGKKLCFDVQNMPDFKGKTCVSNGGTIQWSGTTIVYIGDASQGRDDTLFRVRNAVFTDERIRYVIEWHRQGEWHAMQDVFVDRLTGDGISHFMSEQGGDSIVCQQRSKKL
jgi:hypothetical protein